MALTKATYSMIKGSPANVVDFGSGTELGALLQAAIDAGETNIQIPDATNWTWTTPVVIPELWRGRIVSFQSKSTAHSIIAQTGNNYPCIDAQGALFVEIDGLNVTASGLNSPACFIVFARMPSGASSSNHRMVNNLIEGQFYYCGIYNVGGEELFFENNYFATYGCANSIEFRTASIVHTLNEDSYFSGIITKAARTNGTSTSAIKHIGDVVKNFNVGGSSIYVGPNVNDVCFDLTYGYTSPNSYFLSLGGYFDGINLGVDRVETEKTSPIVYAPTISDSGLINIYRGAFRRSGSTDPTKPIIFIEGGTTSNVVNINISGSVTWTSSFGGQVEDIYVLKSNRKSMCDISLLNGGVINTFSNSVLEFAALQNSSIVTGQASNVTIGTEFGGCKYWFFSDENPTSPSHLVTGGAKILDGTEFDGQTTTFNAKFGSYSARTSIADSTSLSIHDYFLNPNGVIGSITTNGSTTAYLTSSDYRLKENIKPMASSIALIQQLNPVSYTWKADGSHGEGFIAHELQSVFPNAAVGEKDAVDTKGNPIYQGVDVSFIVPALVKAFQEMKEDFDAYKSLHP